MLQAVVIAAHVNLYYAAGEAAAKVAVAAIENYEPKAFMYELKVRAQVENLQLELYTQLD